MVNYKVNGFLIVLQIRLCDAIQSFNQLDEGSGAAFCITPFACREAHIESLIQRAAENSSQVVKDSDLKRVSCCRAEGKPNRGRINDWSGDDI